MISFFGFLPSSFLISVLLSTIIFSVPVYSVPRTTHRHVLHEKRSRPPPDWLRRSRLESHEIIPVKIALRQRNLENAEDYLYDVAHPRSKVYGQHWTPKQIAETFAPRKEDLGAVRDWLHDAGIHKSRVRASRGRNWINFNATVAEAEALFKAEYFNFEHTRTRTPHVACHEYHVPAHVSKLVDFIIPSVHFDAKVRRTDFSRKSRQTPMLKSRSTLLSTTRDKSKKLIVRRKNGSSDKAKAATIGTELGTLPKQGVVVKDIDVLPANLETCDRQVTPDCVRALYKMPRLANAKNAKDNMLGIVEYAPQSYVPSDLDKFFTNFSSEMMGQRPVFAPIDGGALIENRTFDVNGEADLDLQIAMPLIYPIKTMLYQVGDPSSGASFNNFLDAIDRSYCGFQGGDDPNEDAVYPELPGGYIGPESCGGLQATKVISTSFGYNEADLTEKYVKRQCAEYMKLALQGITVLYSSGDYGVAGNQGTCIDPKTGNYTMPDSKDGVFNPSFPGGCPWVTSIGATEIVNGTNVVSLLAQDKQPEKACETVIRSGGGFSNVFEMPLYQASTVHKWWQEHPPPYSDTLFNNSQRTRGFPDVSANGANYIVAVDGNFTLVYGTSASAPAFASMITLINQERMNAGKGSVGFLNQVLYEHPEIMKDVTVGKNSGCGTPGFPAVEGWDPVTGLGTPIYPKMLDLFMKLP